MRDWTGIPFSKFKCFELVKEVFKVEKGIDIGDYREKDYYDRWEKIDPAAIKMFDVVALDLSDDELHVGIVLKGGTFLHTVRNSNSRTSKMSLYSSRIKGFYRWRN